MLIDSNSEGDDDDDDPARERTPTTATSAAVANAFYHHPYLGWFVVHKPLEQSCSKVTEYDYKTRWWTRSSLVRVFSCFFVFFRVFSQFSIHWHSYSVSDTIGLYIAMMCKLVRPIRTILQHFATVICYWLFSHFFDISSPMVVFLIYLMQHLIWCRIPFIYLLFLV